jgi:O-antigen ligase
MNALVFTYALTYGGAVVALFKPFHGLLIYVCFAILKPPALWPWAVPLENYSRVIGVAFLLGWAINGFGDGRLGRAKPIMLMLSGYFLWVVLSTAFGMDPARGAPFIEYLAKIVLPFLAAITLVHSWRQLELLIWVIVGSCAFLAYEANLMYLNGYDMEHNLIFLLDNNSVSILMVTSFALALVLAFEESVFWRRVMWFGFAAAMAHVPMMTMSRGGMLGAVVAAGVTVLLVPKTRRAWQMIAAGAVVAVVLAGPSVVEEFTTSFKPEEELDGSAQSRLVLWGNCTEVALKNPLFGIGQECWTLVVESFGWNKNKEAHSLWFQTAAELGFPGVSFLIAFYVLTVTRSRAASRGTDAPWMPLVYRMMAASIAGFTASASFVTVEGFEMPYYVAMIGACATKLAYDYQAASAFEGAEDDEIAAAQAPIHSQWACSG